nr:MarR family transcriptional regulator [bacterium]
MSPAESQLVHPKLARLTRLANIMDREALSAIQVSLGQPDILLFLSEHDGAMQNDLAQALSLRPASVAVTLKRMERCGLLHREPDRLDLRVSRVFLSEKGKALLAQIESIRQQTDERLLAGFTDEEKAQLDGLLSRMMDNLLQ